MRIITGLLLVVSLCIGIQANAQSNILVEDLLDRLQENHMGSISDVFTNEEIQILREHLASSVSEIEKPESVSAVLLYGPENVLGNFGNFHKDDPGVFNLIGVSPLIEFEGAGAFNEDTSMFTVIDNSGNMFELDVLGNYMTWGSIAAPPGESFTGLEYHPTNGMLYGLSTNGAGNSSLSWIDKGNMTATVIGDTGLTLGIALAIDGQGNGYSYDIDNDFLYSINLSTGAGTSVGPIGFDANFGQGLTWDPNTDAIFMSAFNNGLFDSELRQVNTSTGATTSLGTIDLSATVQIGWLGAPNIFLSIEDNTHFEFSFYPNPVIDILTVESNTNIESIEIYSILGNKVFETAINALTSEVNVSALQTGTYILKVITNTRAGAYKFIKY